MYTFTYTYAYTVYVCLSLPLSLFAPSQSIPVSYALTHTLLPYQT